MKLLFHLILVLFLFIVSACGNEQAHGNLITNGNSIKQRFKPPAGYSRPKYAIGSYGEFIRSIPLLAPSAKIIDYRGKAILNQYEHVGILNYDIGDKDLQQCADAVLRVRAEYLFSTRKYDMIRFHFTNGFQFSWSDYSSGKRVVVDSKNSVKLVANSISDTSRISFRKYLNQLYVYAGTISLLKDTKRVLPGKNIDIGDVIVSPGSPGHAVFVCDKVVNSKGNALYLLAEGYTPAQSIHILSNPFNHEISPWYNLSLDDAILITARYSFLKYSIRRF